MTSTGKQITKTVSLGLVTMILYLALYLLEEHVLRISSRGHWYFLIPVTMAFAFSSFHGAFTARFWDVLGVRAKK
ncbi:MAG: hypothetical protein ACE5LB_18410 [Acidiferrobacterales bacterium]